MNLLGHSRAFAYALPANQKEIKRILGELIENGSANLGQAMTMDNVLYYRNSEKDPVLFQMQGRPRFVSVDGVPFPENKSDATAYYYDNILWIPNNDERKAYLKAFEEYLVFLETNREDSDMFELTMLCGANKIFCCRCEGDWIVQVGVTEVDNSWIHVFHNAVNKRLAVPEVDYATALGDVV